MKADLVFETFSDSEWQGIISDWAQEAMENAEGRSFNRKARRAEVVSIYKPRVEQWIVQQGFQNNGVSAEELILDTFNSSIE